MSDYATLISEREQRARKPYRCDDCGWTIHKGETYRRACLVYDASKYTWRRCDCCASWLATPGLLRLIGEWGAGGLPAAIRDELERADGWIFVEVRG